MDGSERVFIGLGSNLGDRAAHIETALTELHALPGVCVVARSRLHETEPVGGPPGQPKYLNAAAELRTTLTPQRLLGRMLEIERAHGRVRDVPAGPRTLDLDLLLFGYRSIQTPRLRVPHPRMWQRSFVLVPLGEICEPTYLAGLRDRLGIGEHDGELRSAAGKGILRRPREPNGS